MQRLHLLLLSPWRFTLACTVHLRVLPPCFFFFSASQIPSLHYVSCIFQLGLVVSKGTETIFFSKKVGNALCPPHGAVSSLRLQGLPRRVLAHDIPPWTASFGIRPSLPSMI
jgi:hypothetical protein